jgi:hypothetical protein
MEKMSKRDEKKLLTALDKAANLSRSGLEPNHVLTKVAREFQLTPQEICRVTETYNKAKSVAFLKSASSDFRANDFPLADSDTVIKSVYEKTASETKQSTTIPMKNYAAMCSYGEEVEKVASERKPRENSCKRDTGSIWKEAMEYEDLQNKVRKDISDRYAATRNDLEQSMRKVAEYCESSPNKDLSKVARMLVNAYGEQGHKFIDDVNNRMSKPKLPKLEKTAHAAMFPVGEPYVSIANAFVQGQKLVKIAKDLEYFDKQADSSVLNALQMSSILKNLSKGDAKIKPDFIDARTGMSPEWDNYLKALKAKKMLYNLYRFDPIIKSYPLDDVTNIYNELSELTPALSDNKAWMRSAVRRMLTQGGAVDPFELKDMMTSEKERATTAKDYVTALTKMYDDSEKGADNKKNISIKQETPVYL